MQQSHVMSREFPVFYDCEASSLDGFVIEIGWALAPPGGGKIVSAGYLVRPAPDWEIEASWDPNAEALHGVSLDHLLKHGRPAWEVARTMNRALAGRELFSDSPNDELWTRQIFDEAGVDPAFTMRRMDAKSCSSGRSPIAVLTLRVTAGPRRKQSATAATAPRPTRCYGRRYGGWS